MNRWLRMGTLLALAGICLGGTYAWLISAVVAKEGTLYIKTGTSYELLVQQMETEGFLTENKRFDLLAKVMRYHQRVKPGKYAIAQGMSVFGLVRKLRSGNAETVKVSFHNVRDLAVLAGRVAPQIEADSVEILTALENERLWLELDAKGPVFCHIVPNTYEFYWNTSGEAFVARMVKESRSFWTDDRMAQAQAVGLTPCEVVNLAAIVQEEQGAILDEQPTIAGLYLNRLRIRMPLQADPTLKYAAGDFGLKRILNEHKELESPYNTYKYNGLPPSPIVIPEMGAIEAVLRAEKHSHLYMCAKEDLSGRHYFTNSLDEHNRYARRYRRAIERR
ncbi:MAG: endolytic transglycosylase MltG [Bacteroidetes bacterium]|jgi:UPF0755 protein|nr:endolytic transglycosylase MltG [Bacteroidota bacterium]